MCNEDTCGYGKNCNLNTGACECHENNTNGFWQKDDDDKCNICKKENGKTVYFPNPNNNGNCSDINQNTKEECDLVSGDWTLNNNSCLTYCSDILTCSGNGTCNTDLLNSTYVEGESKCNCYNDPINGYTMTDPTRTDDVECTICQTGYFVDPETDKCTIFCDIRKVVQIEHVLMVLVIIEVNVNVLIILNKVFLVRNQCNQCKTDSEDNQIYFPSTGENACKTLCVPSQTCLGNGICNIDGECDCYNNEVDGYWSGNNCSICQNNYYTLSCNVFCNDIDGSDQTCKNGTCDSNNGSCICDDGFGKVLN